VSPLLGEFKVVAFDEKHGARPAIQKRDVVGAEAGKKDANYMMMIMTMMVIDMMMMIIIIS
jgi:hypothetical protein